MEMHCNNISILPKLCEEQWSNEACLGYVILACVILGYSSEEKYRLISTVEETFGNYTVSQAKKIFYDRLKEMFDDFDLSYSSIATAYRKIRSEVYYTHKEYAPLRYLP